MYSPAQLFILRKFIEYELQEIGLGPDEVYFCSLSSATVVYKGQLTPEQVRAGLSRIR
jgi:glutamate synthase (NADPH/NADH)